MSSGIFLSLLIFTRIFYPADLNYPVYYPHYYLNSEGYYEPLRPSPWETQQIREVKKVAGEFSKPFPLMVRLGLVCLNYLFTPSEREILPYMLFARRRGILLQNFLLYHIMKKLNDYRLPGGKGYVFVDFHLHSFFSHDSISSFDATVIEAYRKGIGAIVVSDHDFSYPYFKRRLEKLKSEGKVGKDFLLIPAEEVTTKNGHLLALFIKNRLYPGLTLEETVREVNEQGGVAVLPHLNLYTTGAGFNSVSLATSQGFEILNGGNFLPYNIHQNLKLLWKEKHHAFSNSDAHVSSAVGLYVTRVYLGHRPLTLENLRRAVLDGDYEPFIPSDFMRWYVNFVQKFSPYFLSFDYYYSLKLKIEMLLSKISGGEVRFWLNLDRGIYYLANLFTLPLGYRMLRMELDRGIRIEEIYWEHGPFFFYFENGRVRKYRLGILKVF